MNYNKLRYFYEASRTLNLTRAAQNLYISQPALSKHIADLEHQKSDAETLRDRYKEHFMAEIEKERTRHAAELDQERKRCDSELIRRDQQHEAEKKIIRRRGTVRFVLAMSLAALSTLLFGLYLGADMILSGDYALLRQLFQ